MNHAAGTVGKTPTLTVFVFFWRAETQGSHSLVFKAIKNFDQLNAGRKLAEK